MGAKLAWLIQRQRPHDSNKPYALYTPELECIGKGKGKARQPFQLGVKVNMVVTHKSGLAVGTRSFPGNVQDGYPTWGVGSSRPRLCRGTWGQAQRGHSRPGLLRRRSPGAPQGQPPQPVRDDDRPAAALAEAKTGHRADDRADQAGSRDAALLLEGQRWR